MAKPAPAIRRIARQQFTSMHARRIVLERRTTAGKDTLESRQHATEENTVQQSGTRRGGWAGPFSRCRPMDEICVGRPIAGFTLITSGWGSVQPTYLISLIDHTCLHMHNSSTSTLISTSASAQLRPLMHACGNTTAVVACSTST